MLTSSVAGKIQSPNKKQTNKKKKKEAKTGFPGEKCQNRLIVLLLHGYLIKVLLCSLLTII